MAETSELLPQAEGGVTVKALEWQRSGLGRPVDTMSRAECLLGSYRVWSLNGRWFWHLSGVIDGSAASEAEAKAAAQADYEDRIRSALTPAAPVQAEGGGTWWAVWSPSGAHVGLWSDKETAEGVLAEFGAGGTIKQLSALAPAHKADEGVTYARLAELAGYVASGDYAKVSFCQDDSTREWIVRVGNKLFWGESLRDAFNHAFLDSPASNPMKEG